MTHQSECTRAIQRYYRDNPHDVGCLRSAYADAAHLCDAIAKDWIEANRHGKRQPRMEVKAIADAITRAGNAIYALRDDHAASKGPSHE